MKPNSFSDASAFRWKPFLRGAFSGGEFYVFFVSHRKIQASLRDVFQVLNKSGITAEDDLKTSKFFIWVIFVATW